GTLRLSACPSAPRIGDSVAGAIPAEAVSKGHGSQDSKPEGKRAPARAGLRLARRCRRNLIARCHGQRNARITTGVPIGCHNPPCNWGELPLNAPHPTRGSSRCGGWKAPPRRSGAHIRSDWDGGASRSAEVQPENERD